ncbi:MAG: hypothetical protein AAF480_12580 [Actinomycetota bacterium]
MAVSERFQQAYRRLSGAFGAHQDVPREPDRVAELAGARAELEDRRSEMKAVRQTEGLEPFRRENPDWVDPDIGKGATGWTGKFFAVFAMLVLVGGVVLIAGELGGGGDDEPVVVDLSITAEPKEQGGCVVAVAGLLRNDSSAPIRVIAVNFDAVDRANGRSLDTWPGGVDRSYLLAGESAVVTASFAVPVTLVDPPSCPDSLAGDLRVTYAPPTGPLQVLKVGL